MTQQSIDSNETIEKVREVNRFVEDLYDLLGRISMYEPSKVFKNFIKGYFYQLFLTRNQSLNS